MVRSRSAKIQGAWIVPALTPAGGSPDRQPAFSSCSELFATAAFAMVRFGLVTLFWSFFVLDLVLNLPMTTDFSAWFIGTAIFCYASVAAIAVWAFHTAVAGQKLWKEALLD